MGKHFFKVVALLFVLIFCVSACGKNNDTPQTNVPGSSEVPTVAPDKTVEYTEFLTEVTKDAVLPDPPSSATGLDPELAEEYAKMYPTEKAARTSFLEAYQALVVITVNSSDDKTANVTFETPDLAAIVIEAVQKVGADADTSDIENAMTEILVSGEYTTRSQTCVIAMSKDKEGVFVLEKTTEYWDAVYGGLLSLADELLESLGG